MADAPETPRLDDAAREFFRAKGRQGGLARAANMTPRQRSIAAQKAVRVRVKLRRAADKKA